ncbi:MAG: DUF3237 domain-containing protein [Alphaproteobacteria bacterium]|jgi:hypothetical protein|nr:DUF3237 domain-containing protein [Alphaproteobacteria bacterium]
MTGIASRHLFDIQIGVEAPQSLGATPFGERRIVYLTGGSFEGERLKGRILPGGGDWLLGRNDGSLQLDVRLTLETDDKALIYMTYRGIRHGPEAVIARLNAGEQVDPSEYYFRTTPYFETAAERYAWLNTICAVGLGDRTPDGPRYAVWEVL